MPDAVNALDTTTVNWWLAYAGVMFVAGYALAWWWNRR
jgi:hypothetical protein